MAVSALLCAVDPRPAAASIDDGQFVSLPTTPVLDTRSGLGASAGILPANGSVSFQLAGRAGVPASSVTAVAVTVQANSPTAYGWFSLYPSDQPTTASMLTYHQGEATVGADVVRLSTTGKLTLKNNGAGAQAHAIVAVRGYFTAGGGATYHPLGTPLLYDTRSGTGTPARTTPILGNGGTAVFDVAGTFGVPATGVDAVAVNVVATQHTDKGWLTLVPSDQSPGSGGLTYVPGEDNATLMITQLTATGDLKITNHGAGPVHVSISARGYFTVPSADDTGLPYHPVPTATIYDTVSGIGGAGTSPLSAGATVTLDVTSASELNPDEVLTAALNINARQATQNGWLSAYPADEDDPNVSSVNFATAESTNGFDLTVPSFDGRIKITNHSAGTVHVTVTVTGYFTEVDNPDGEPGPEPLLVEEGTETVPIDPDIEPHTYARVTYKDYTAERALARGGFGGWIWVRYRTYSNGRTRLLDVRVNAHNAGGPWPGYKENIYVAWRGVGGKYTYFWKQQNSAGVYWFIEDYVGKRYPRASSKPYVKIRVKWSHPIEPDYLSKTYINAYGRPAE